jgi:hypothetical protein
LWRGSDFRKKAYNLAAWDLVRWPKSKGGLGVINLSLQNDALLLKQLDKFYRKENVQWVKLIWQKYYATEVPHMAREKGSFWWKDILRMNVQYRGVASCIPNKGDTLCFWEDLLEGKIFAQEFPNLFHFAKDPRISLWKLRRAEQLIDCFRIPMSRQAYNEFLELQEVLAHLQPALPDGNDSWVFIWGQQKYSSRRYYQYQFRSLQPHRTIIWIWRMKCIPKIKFFA